MDEFREEREKIKTAPAKQKWKYFRDYYLIYVVIACVVLAIIISVAHTVLTHKEDALYVCMVNFEPNGEAGKELTEAFTTRSGIDTKKEQISIESGLYISPDTGEDGAADPADAQQQAGGTQSSGTSSGGYSASDAMKYRYEDEQRLVALVFTQSIDLMITGEDVFDRFGKEEYFAPLSLVYGEDVLKRLEEEGRLKYEDGAPVGIYMDDVPGIRDNYRYNGEEGQRIVAGFLYGCKHPELAVDFLDFLEGK